jgi:Tol biopolymer transport system component
MITEATTLRSGTEGKARSVVLVSLALGAVLAALVALMAAPAREAEATFPGTNGKIVFISKRTTGTGVDNPTGDSEIFTINPDGTGLKQLTVNTGDDREPTLSPDGQKIAYTSQGDPTSNPGGDYEVYLMNAADGSGQTNLSNSGATDGTPVFSPDGTKIAFETNRDGNFEIYGMRADGSEPVNLTNDPAGDFTPDWQPVR